MGETFSKSTYRSHCNKLRKQYHEIDILHIRYGFPPYWKRENNFQSLCRTIIEQQVSLASAKSSFERLKNYCNSIIPAELVKLDEAEFRANGITKQKGKYLKLLSEKLILEPDFFISLEKLDNDSVREKLISLKGIGPWTANVYMLVALNRINIYPDFDVALINSIAHEAFNGEKIGNEIAKEFIAQFAPLQSIASCFYYHAYIKRKGIVFIP
jgi:DNA-3-methyladenine glycosylase II